MSQRRNPFRLARREVVGVALAMPAIFGLGRQSARAASKDVVLMMSGGSFMATWQSKIIEPFQKSTGYRVKMAPGNNRVQAMALRANPGNPAVDVYLGNGDEFIRLLDAGLVAPQTPSTLPNLAQVFPKFRDPWQGYGAYFDYSSVGIAYRPDRIKRPPGSWREFVDRTADGEFGDQVFLNSMAAGVRGPEVLVTLARALTGDPQNIDAGFAALKRMKPHVFKFFTSFNDPVVLLLNDEGAIGTGWDGRTFIAADESKGKVAWIKPKEGAASSGPVIAAVKGGNEEGAAALVNYALGAEAQKAFMEAMFYGSVNSQVVYSEALAGRIPRVDDVDVPNERFLMKNVSGWIERWNREIAA